MERRASAPGAGDQAVPEGTLTIMFEDLEGSTGLATNMGDETWRALRNVHGEIVRDRITRHGGEEIQFLGDGFMLAFESVRRALACAVDIQRSLEERNRTHAGPGLRARIGLNVGEVLRDEETLVGAAVNAASRIAARAEGGQILASSVVRDLAGSVPDVSFADRGLVQLKGLADRSRLYEVVWRSDDSSRLLSPRGRTRFVGRRTEHIQLRDLIGRTEAGEGSLVLIGGEAGVGKTRLAEEIAVEASVQGFLALGGRCREMEGAPPYLPFVEILEAAMRALPPEALREALADSAGEIARLVPELRRLFDDVPEPVRLPPEQSRRYLYNCFAEFLERTGARQPVLLILDDLHWADSSTLLLLEHLAERLADMRVVVLGTYRDVELDLSRPLGRSLETLLRTRLAHRLALKPLPEAGVEEMLGALAGSMPPGDIVAAVFSETEGNPFFVEEVFQHLTEEGRLLDPHGGWRIDFRPGVLDVPESVRLVIGRRLERLSVPTRTILESAAVVGREFDADLLSVVTEVESAFALETIDEAERARLVIPAPEGLGSRFGFSHELIRQTLAGGLSTLKRQRIHARVAGALEARFGEDPGRAADIAYHLLQAGAAVDREKPVPYLQMAAERAQEAAAFDEALRDFDAALALHPAPDRARADLLFGSGRALRSLGQWDEVMQRWHEAIRLYQVLGESEAGGAACLEAANQLSWAVRWEEALDMAGQGLAALEGAASADRARLLALTSIMFSGGGYYDAAKRLFEDALEVARALGDPALLGYVDAHRTAHAFFFLQHREGADAGRRAVEALRASGSVWVMVQAMGFLSLLLQWGGHTAEAADIQREGEALASRLGHHGVLFTLRGTRNLAHAMRGDLDAYQAAAHEEMERSAELGWVAFAHLWLGVIAFWRGRTDEALEHFRQADASQVAAAFGGIDWGLLLLGCAHAGRREEALDVFERHRRDLPQPGEPATVGSWTLLLGAVEGLAILGERDEAAKLYPMVLELIESGQAIRPFDTRLVETVAGIAAGTGRRWEDAERHFQTATHLAEELPHRLERPEVRRFYAQMMVDRDEPGDRERARSLLKESIEGYRELGMPAHEAMARDLLKGLRARRAGRARADLDDVAAAFRREGDYWTIAYEGRVSRLKDSSGLRYIARLLASPGRELHATDLVTPTAGAGRGARPGDELTVRSGLGDAGEFLDSQAKAAYKRRLDHLAEELAEAEEWADPERAARARAEIDALTEELARAVGLGGRDRKAASTTERARVNATKAIRNAIKRIAENDASLAHHLDTAIRTGTFCSYVPDPDKPLDWQL